VSREGKSARARSITGENVMSGVRNKGGVQFAPDSSLVANTEERKNRGAKKDTSTLKNLQQKAKEGEA